MMLMTMTTTMVVNWRCCVRGSSSEFLTKLRNNAFLSTAKRPTSLSLHHHQDYCHHHHRHQEWKQQRRLHQPYEHSRPPLHNHQQECHLQQQHHLRRGDHHQQCCLRQSNEPHRSHEDCHPRDHRRQQCSHICQRYHLGGHDLPCWETGCSTALESNTMSTFPASPISIFVPSSSSSTISSPSSSSMISLHSWWMPASSPSSRSLSSQALSSQTPSSQTSSSETPSPQKASSQILEENEASNISIYEILKKSRGETISSTVEKEKASKIEDEVTEKVEDGNKKDSQAKIDTERGEGSSAANLDDEEKKKSVNDQNAPLKSRKGRLFSVLLGTGVGLATCFVFFAEIDRSNEQKVHFLGSMAKGSKIFYTFPPEENGEFSLKKYFSFSRRLVWEWNEKIIEIYSSIFL